MRSEFPRYCPRLQSERAAFDTPLIRESKRKLRAEYLGRIARSRNKRSLVALTSEMCDLFITGCVKLIAEIDRGMLDEGCPPAEIGAVSCERGMGGEGCCSSTSVALSLPAM